MISIENLRVSFHGKEVLNCKHAAFEEGKVHGIIGLNGAGKTTFFNALAKYLKPDSGQLLMDDRPLQKSEIGYLETGNFFYSNITGKEYLDIFPSTNTRFNLAQINQLLQLPLDQIVETYSTGMKKKLALLGIIKQDKPVYIFDEPFNGLDLESNKVVELIVDNLRSKSKTIFISSHILSPLAGVCDAIHLLHQGSFIKTFTRQEFSVIDEALFGDFSRAAREIVSGAV